MFGRRRPLLRGAAVGGAAYYAGKKHAQAASGSKGGAAKTTADKINELKQLHDSGALTDEEFAKAKDKIIAEM